jgi:hypothetical protein
MKILRLTIESTSGKFLIHAEHEHGEIVALRLHPILNDTVGPRMAGKAMEGMGALVVRVKKLIVDLQAHPEKIVCGAVYPLS